MSSISSVQTFVDLQFIIDRKRKADVPGEGVAETGAKTMKTGAPSQSPHPDRGTGDDSLAVVTIDNVVIKGYHVFKRRPLLGLNMDVVRDYNNSHDKDALLVTMPALEKIPTDQHDVVTDDKRGTTVKAIAGKTVGRLPCGLASILARKLNSADVYGMTCVATGLPRQSFAPWPKPERRRGGAVIPCEVCLEVRLRDKDAVKASLKEEIDQQLGPEKAALNVRG
ncbi:uncharacterized protein LOC144915128 [Branchiostoma floridae x Branchiostoma belcheri]